MGGPTTCLHYMSLCNNCSAFDKLRFLQMNLSQEADDQVESEGTTVFMNAVQTRTSTGVYKDNSMLNIFHIHYRERKSISGSGFSC